MLYYSGVVVLCFVKKRKKEEKRMDGEDKTPKKENPFVQPSEINPPYP